MHNHCTEKILQANDSVAIVDGTILLNHGIIKIENIVNYLKKHQMEKHMSGFIQARLGGQF